MFSNRASLARIWKTETNSASLSLWLDVKAGLVPDYQVLLGRLDGTFASETLANKFLPGPGLNYNALKENFANVSLDETDLVALSGTFSGFLFINSPVVRLQAFCALFAEQSVRLFISSNSYHTGLMSFSRCTHNWQNPLRFGETLSGRYCKNSEHQCRFLKKRMSSWPKPDQLGR